MWKLAQDLSEIGYHPRWTRRKGAAGLGRGTQLHRTPGDNRASLPREENPRIRQRLQPREETYSARAPRDARARGDHCPGPRRAVGKGRRAGASQKAGDSRVVGRSRAPTGGRRGRRRLRPRCPPPAPRGGSRSRLRRQPVSGARPLGGARARSLRHPPAPAPAAAPPPPPTFCRRHHRHFLLCFPLLS